MSPDFALIVEECVQRLRRGQTIEDCLALYPQHTEALRPLLQAAAYVRSLPLAQPRPQALQAGRARMLSAAQQKFNAASPVSFGMISRYSVRIFTNFKFLLLGKENKGMKLALRLALDVVVIFLIGSFLTLNASASSLPGDPLYGVKRTWEDVRLGLTLDSKARQSLETQFARERQQEVQDMIAQGRQGTLDIEGTLETVEGKIWTVSGLAILVEPQTVIEGDFGLGVRVTVHAQVRNDGQVVALRVRFHTPQPAASTHTPEASHTPEATHEPTYTPMPNPSMTLVATHTPEPSHTPEDTHEPTHTVMPPSMTPMPTHTPEETHEPTHTAMPNPTMTMTPNPTMCDPTHTAEPTDDDDHGDEGDHGSEDHP